MIRKHLLILFGVTLILRGVMFVSYPMGGVDDDQSAQRYLIHELVNGNWQIGNLRYNTGYPFVIAPITRLAAPLGRFDDRAVLLFQMAFSASIPFMVYDLLRRRRPAQEALIVALVVAVDPFGLQWAHWAVPTWLVAWAIVLGLWLAERMRLAPDGQRWRWMLGAGLVLGAAAIARTEAAIVAAALGVAVLCLRSITLWRRVGLFAVLGVSSAGVLGLYLLTVQLASTGIVQPSCMTGIDLLFSAQGKRIPLVAENGPHTTEALTLLALEPPQEILLHMVDGGYANWRNPDSWASEEAQRTFLQQPTPEPLPAIQTALPNTLVYYLGLCPTDELLNRVIGESFVAYPGRWIAGLLDTTWRILTHVPDDCCSNQYLPAYEHVNLASSGFALADTLGFRTANGGLAHPRPFSPGGEFYTGQVVWGPGLWLFPRLLAVTLPLFWLLPLAILRGIWARDWLTGTVVWLVLVGAFVTAFFNVAQPRIYASFYPLHTMLLGGLLAWLVTRIQAWRSA